MKCGDTCRHNISKLNSGLSVKLLQLPLQRSGKALEENLEGACSIFLQKSFILVRHIYWMFRLLRGGWLGCTLAFVKWHLSHYPLNCHHTPTLPLHPPPPPRARARLVSSSPLPPHTHTAIAFREGIRRKFRRGMFHIFAKKFHFGTPHLLDFQVAAWWLARLYACFRKVAPFALPVEVFALVHCHHTPTLPLHPPPPPRARARPPRLVKPRHGWLGLAWYGMAWCESQVLS